MCPCDCLHIVSFCPLPPIAAAAAQPLAAQHALPVFASLLRDNEAEVRAGAVAALLGVCRASQVPQCAWMRVNHRHVTLWGYHSERERKLMMTIRGRWH